MHRPFARICYAFVRDTTIANWVPFYPRCQYKAETRTHTRTPVVNLLQPRCKNVFLLTSYLVAKWLLWKITVGYSSESFLCSMSRKTTRDTGGNQKNSPVEDRGQTDRVTALPHPTRWILTFDLDFQNQARYGHDPHLHNNSRSKVSRLKRQSGNN